MTRTYALVAALLTLASTACWADTRNPFDPASARSTASKAAPGQARTAAPKAEASSVSSSAMTAPMLPPILPPPIPPAPAKLPLDLPPPAAPAPAPASAVEAAPAKSKESPMRQAAAACKLKAKNSSVFAPAHGGLVTIELLGSGKDCASAVMVEQPWLEARELNDPTAIRVAVDANDTEAPRQSSIIIANAAQSLTVTLVQEGRIARNR